jgi:hypothetical protein
VDQTFDVAEIEIGFHPAGYRIDKTASAMNRYTRWNVSPGKRWSDPKPVCFDSMPKKGWFKKDRFDWDKIRIAEGVPS